MPAIPIGCIWRDLSGRFLQSLAVWRPLLSLAGMARSYRCVSAIVQFLHQKPRNSGGHIPPNDATCARRYPDVVRFYRQVLK